MPLAFNKRVSIILPMNFEHYHCSKVDKWISCQIPPTHINSHDLQDKERERKLAEQSSSSSIIWQIYILCVILSNWHSFLYLSLSVLLFPHTPCLFLLPPLSFSHSWNFSLNLVLSLFDLILLYHHFVFSRISLFHHFPFFFKKSLHWMFYIWIYVHSRPPTHSLFFVFFFFFFLLSFSSPSTYFFPLFRKDNILKSSSIQFEPLFHLYRNEFKQKYGFSVQKRRAKKRNAYTQAKCTHSVWLWFFFLFNFIKTKTRRIKLKLSIGIWFC